MKNLLVIAATANEIRGITTTASSQISKAICGVGPVEAGIRSMQVLLQDSPSVDAVLHVGIAGCVSKADIPIGSTVIGTSSLYCDSESDLVKQVVKPDSELLNLTTKILPDAYQEPIATSANVTGLIASGEEVVRVEGMEGFAVLSAAKLLKVPAIEVRVISNQIDETDRSKWQFDKAIEILGTATNKLINGIIDEK